ncbi:hypothetical protein ASE61_13540 [Bosea sp. Root670]|nr:hypothetical protein ASE61_13540 [Bosea sp. Root670]
MFANFFRFGFGGRFRLRHMFELSGSVFFRELSCRRSQSDSFLSASERGRSHGSLLASLLFCHWKSPLGFSD